MRRLLTLVPAAALMIMLLTGADLFDLAGDEPAFPAAVPVPAGVSSAPAADTSDCGYVASAGVYEDYLDLVNFTDPFKGSSQAPVVVIEFLDPNCPHCKALHPVMQDIIAEHREDAQFVLKPFPVFRYSFPQILALRVAAQENKFFEMLDRQFAMQQPGSGLRLSQLKDIAREIGIDPEKMERQMNSEVFQKQVVADYRKISQDVNITSVPAVMINGRIVAPKSRTSTCISELIEQASAE